MYKFCSAPWDTMGISNNGEVQICLCMDWHNYPPIGNIFESTLADIYNSAKTNTFRKTIVDQSFSYCDKNRCGRYWGMPDVESIYEEIVKVKRTLPTNLALGLDENCNLACASCRSHRKFESTINKNAFDILGKLWNEYQNFDEQVNVSLDGSGDLFTSMAWREYLTSQNVPKCFNFRITTNGNLITKNLDLIQNIRHQISGVTVSLDAGTSETYNIIRGGNFNMVLEGIKALTELNIPVHTQYVVQYKNYKEILIYKELAESLKVNQINLSHLNRWGHMTDAWWDENKIFNNPNVDYNFLSNALKVFDDMPNCSMHGGLKAMIIDK